MSLSHKLNASRAQSKTGAWLVRYALEQIGVKYTFGIPGVHNTEIYDELNKSTQIQPILVTHEGGASFMADAISRTTDSIGTCLIVPAAGVTHAASGIAEASLDGIPMLIISGGIRTDTGAAYQLHDMDQHALLKPITKATYKVERQNDIVATIFKAYQLAMSGEPGPVFVEIPTNISLFKGEVDELPLFENNNSETNTPDTPTSQLEFTILQAAKVLVEAQNPGMFLGWGAAEAESRAIELAELLNAPVSTTLQGLSVFPGNHRLHTGMGFGAYSVPAAQNAFKNCDCLLAIGTRFSEIPTGSFSMVVPEKLIHVDINSEVFSANYPASHIIEGDASVVMGLLIKAIKALNPQKKSDVLAMQIKQDKEKYYNEWQKHNSKGRVNPALFFNDLRKQLKDDDFVVADDGNHTFLTAELMPIHKSKHFISPSDFNCMGYCVPAAISTKIANPSHQVVGIVGDGAFMMTGMELVTAATNNTGVVIFVFSDGELSQISQAQEIPYNRKTCSIIGSLKLQGIADAVGASFFSINDNSVISDVIQKALSASNKNQPVLVDVRIDYSKRTRFTKGVVAANLKRFSLKDKARFIGRALVRKVTG